MRKLLLCVSMSFICLISCLLFMSCQDLFTTEIFAFMQKDPGDMDRDELIRYGWDVIATGDGEKMLAAYNAVKEMLTSTPDDGELAYLAGKLAIEMSGLGDFIMDPPEDNFDLFKSELKSAYIMEAGEYFVVAETNESELNAIDEINCGIGLLLTIAGGDFDVMETIDIDNPDPSELTGVGYIDAGTTIVGSDFRVVLISVFFTVI